jgi:glycosyltransferase involved in cell wall biosynthesis
VLTAPIPIALVMSSFEPGGTERQMIELIRRLDRRRWNVHVACLRNHGAWLERVAAAAPCVMFPVSSFRRPGALLQLRSFARWCRASRFAVVHTVDITANIFGLPAAAVAGVPVRIGTRREVNPGRKAVPLLMQRAAYACAHVIVANARAAADRLRVEQVAEHKVAIVPNGLDVGCFTVRRVQAPVRRVVMVANLRPEKGHDVLIDAASHVLRRFHDARFEVVGSGPEHRRLIALANEHGVSHAVSFIGHCEAVPEQLATADVFVLPSRSEALPNALLEAMAAGLPVVASAVGGILEVLEDGKTGLLVPAGDSQALAGALSRLMADAALAERLGAAARAYVETRYSFDRMVASFENIYLTRLTVAGVSGVPPFWPRDEEPIGCEIPR